MKTPLVYLLKAAVTIVLVWVLLSKIDLGRFLLEIKNVEFRYFVLVAIVAMISWMLNSLRWEALLKIFKIQTKLYRLFFYNLASVFYSFVLPGGKIAGDVILAYQIAKDHSGGKDEKPQAFLTAFLDRGIGLLSMVIFVAGYFIFRHPAFNYLGPGAFIFGAGVSLAGILGIGFIFSSAFDWFFDIFAKIPLASLRKFLTFVSQSLKACRSNKPQLIKSLFFAFLSVFISSFSIYFLSRALALDISFWTLALFNALATILILVPVTVAGIGLREGALAYLLVRAGINPESAVALSFWNLSALLIIALAGGLAEFYSHFLAGKKHD